MIIPRIHTANLGFLSQVINETWVRGFLTGLVYGPHVELSLLQFIDAMPPGYTVRGYPDLCHTIKSQFEVRLSVLDHQCIAFAA